MTNSDFTVQPAISDRSTTLFRSVLAAILGAACALAVMQRASAPFHPGSSSLRSAIGSYGGSPCLVNQAIGDYPVASFTFLGAEPAQYMLVVFFSLVGVISWKINQARLGIAHRDRPSVDCGHASRQRPLDGRHGESQLKRAAKQTQGACAGRSGAPFRPACRGSIADDRLLP